MALALDRNLQAPPSVRAAVRKLAQLHQPDERTELWQRKLREYTRGEQDDRAAPPSPGATPPTPPAEAGDDTT